MSKSKKIEELEFAIGLDMTNLDRDFVKAQQTTKTGIKNLKGEINRIKLQLEVDTAALGPAATSSQKLTLQEKSLTDQLIKQKQVVELANAEYQNMVKEKGENDISSRKLKTSLLREQKAMEDLNNKLTVTRKNMGPTGQGITNLGNKLETMKGQLLALSAVAAAGFGLGKVVTEAAAAGEGTYQLSKRLGVTTEEAGKFGRVLRMGGADAQNFSSIMMRLDKQVLTAGENGNELTRAMATFNFHLRDNQGNLLSLTDQVEQLAQGYAHAAEQGKEDEYVTQVLGNKGQELIPILRDIAELKEDAAKIRTTSILDPDLAHQVTRETRIMNDQLRQLSNILGASLLPAVNDLLPPITDSAGALAGFIKENKDGVSAIVATTGEVLALATAIKGISYALALIPKGALVGLGAKVGLGTVAGAGAAGAATAVGTAATEAAATGTATTGATSAIAGSSGAGIASALGATGIGAIAAIIGLGIKNYQDSYYASRTKALVGQRPDKNNANVRKNNEGKWEKEIDDPSYGFKTWTEVTPEEAAVLNERENNASGGSNALRALKGDKSRDESAKTGKLAQQLSEEQLKKQQEIEKATQQMKLETARLSHTQIANELADLEVKAREYKAKGIAEVNITRWKEAEKARIIQDFNDNVVNKINETWESSLQTRLNGIEREKKAWEQKGVAEIAATKWAEEQKKDVLRQTALDALKNNKKDFEEFLSLRKQQNGSGTVSVKDPITGEVKTVDINNKGPAGGKVSGIDAKTGQYKEIAIGADNTDPMQEYLKQRLAVQRKALGIPEGTSYSQDDIQAYATAQKWLQGNLIPGLESGMPMPTMAGTNNNKIYNVQSPTININLNNPTVRDNSDITAITNQITDQIKQVIEDYIGGEPNGY